MTADLHPFDIAEFADPGPGPGDEDNPERDGDGDDDDVDPFNDFEPADESPQ